VSTNSPSLRRGLFLTLCVLVVVALVVWLVRDRAQATESTSPPTPAVTALRESETPVLADALVAPRDVLAADSAVGSDDETVTASGMHRLTGVVRPAVGRAELVGDVAVVATDTLGEARKCIAAADGTYAFEELAPGRYSLSSRSPQNGSINVTVEVRGDTRLDLQLEAPRAIAIRVVDEIGKPTAELAVFAIATPELPGEWCEDVRGGQQNPVGCGFFRSTRFPFAEGPPEIIGHVHLDRAPPVYVSLCKYQRVLETRRIEGDTELLDFVLRTDDERLASGGIRLRVVDAETQVPLEKVTVTASSDVSRFGASVAGVHRFDGLNPGTHRLQMMGKGYATQRLDVRVLPGQVNDLGDVPMAKGYWVAGRILDETGEGAKCSIRFDPCEPDGRIAPIFDAIWTYPTKGDGTFRVAGLAPGFHRLEVMGESGESKWAECVAVFDVRNGPIENARLTLTLGVPLVVDPDGKHGPGVRFAVIDENGVRVVSRLVTEPQPVRVSLAPGRYTIEFKSSREDPDPRTSAFELVREPVVVQMR